LKSTTSVYFCHPYASYERGSSENQHKLIRRYMPKGRPLRDVSESHVLRTQQWMNTYPRKILNYQTPQEAFKDELKHIVYRSEISFSPSGKKQPPLTISQSPISGNTEVANLNLKFRKNIEVD